MTSLRSWSLGRVLLVCVGWIVLSLVAIVLWMLQSLWIANSGTGSGGIGAVSIGINALVLAVPVAPPIALIVAWLIVRVRR